MVNEWHDLRLLFLYVQRVDHERLPAVHSIELMMDGVSYVVLAGDRSRV